MVEIYTPPCTILCIAPLPVIKFAQIFEVETLMHGLQSYLLWKLLFKQDVPSRVWGIDVIRNIYQCKLATNKWHDYIRMKL